MLRRVAAPAARVAMPATALAAQRDYNFFVWKNPVRRPQLSEEERAAVKINYDEWPAEFKDYDPENPYKNTPDYIDGFSTWTYFIWGMQIAFIYHMWETVFPKSI